MLNHLRAGSTFSVLQYCIIQEISMYMTCVNLNKNKSMNILFLQIFHFSTQNAGRYTVLNGFFSTESFNHLIGICVNNQI